MTRSEYAEMVDYIEDRWGKADAWSHAVNVYGDFEEIPAEACWEVLKLRLTGDPEKARWAPNPAELLAASLDWMRPRMAKRALPETTEEYGWAEFCQRKWGEYRPLKDVVEAVAQDLNAE